MNFAVGVMLSNWTLARRLWLLAGIGQLASAWVKSGTLFFSFDALFAYQKFFSIRGCGMGACASGVCSSSPPLKDAGQDIENE